MTDDTIFDLNAYRTSFVANTRQSECMLSYFEMRVARIVPGRRHYAKRRERACIVS